jgi:hypothetical protein
LSPLQTYYQLVVTNNFGSVTSVVSTLTSFSGSPSFIVDLPTASSFYIGHVIQLHVYAGGTAPFTYQWTKNGTPIVNDYRTSGQGTDTLTIGYAAATDSGNYQVTVSNGSGSLGSAVDAVSVVPGTPNIFSTSASDWTLQGTTPPVFSPPGNIQLTANLGSTARSAFMTAKQNITSFNASYIYQDTTGSGGADGVTFCIQNQAVTALGGGGGGLGYSGITPSVALAFNIYAPNTHGILLLQNGAVTPPFVSLPNIDIGGSADQVRVDINYANKVLAATFTDLTTSAKYTTNLTVDIPTVVGANTAWVGFTGADGGVASTQLVFVNVGGVLKQIPLNAQVVGNSLVFTWPADIGAILETSPSLTNPSWVQSTAQFQVIGNTAQATAPITKTAAGQYFRLHMYY